MSFKIGLILLFNYSKIELNYLVPDESWSGT